MKHYIFDLDDTLYINPFNYNKMYDILPDNDLINLLNNCPYSKYIYTNAMFEHANIIINKLNIQSQFDKIYSRDTIPSMKPYIQSVIDVEKNIILNKGGTNNNEFVFFDDLLPNLKTAKQNGWTTIWISPSYFSKDKYEFIDYAFPNIKKAISYCNKYNI